MVDQVIEFEQLTEPSTEVTALVYALNNKFPYMEAFDLTVTYLTEGGSNTQSNAATRNGEPRIVIAQVPLPF